MLLDLLFSERVADYVDCLIKIACMGFILLPDNIHKTLRIVLKLFVLENTSLNKH